MLDSFAVHLRRSDLPRLSVSTNSFWDIRVSSIELAPVRMSSTKKISQYSSLHLVLQYVFPKYWHILAKTGLNDTMRKPRHM